MRNLNTLLIFSATICYLLKRSPAFQMNMFDINILEDIVVLFKKQNKNIYCLVFNNCNISKLIILLN